MIQDFKKDRQWELRVNRNRQAPTASAQTPQNPLQLVQTAELDGDLARPFFVAANGDIGTHRIGDFFLQS